MSKDELIQLADRVEKATGPEYALDCAIWDAIYPGERQARFDRLTSKGQPYHNRLGPADFDGYVQPLRAFTASIDAASTLAPDGYDWCLYRFDGFAGCAPYDADGAPSGSICGATPALALTAACLRALAATSEGSAS